MEKSSTAYLTEYTNLKEAREAIDNKRSAEVYYPAMLLDAARAAA